MRPRRRWRTPSLDPAERREAQSAVRAAYHRLEEALRREPEVSDRADTLARVRRENNLAPKIRAALRGES